MSKDSISFGDTLWIIPATPSITYKGSLPQIVILYLKYVQPGYHLDHCLYYNTCCFTLQLLYGFVVIPCTNSRGYFTTAPVTSFYVEYLAYRTGWVRYLKPLIQCLMVHQLDYIFYYNLQKKRNSCN